MHNSNVTLHNKGNLRNIAKKKSKEMSSYFPSQLHQLHPHLSLMKNPTSQVLQESHNDHDNRGLITWLSQCRLIPPHRRNATISIPIKLTLRPPKTILSHFLPLTCLFCGNIWCNSPPQVCVSFQVYHLFIAQTWLWWSRFHLRPGKKFVSLGGTW